MPVGLGEDSSACQQIQWRFRKVSKQLLHVYATSEGFIQGTPKSPLKFALL